MHPLIIYDWDKAAVIFTAHVSESFVSDCQFLGSDKYFGACGKNFIDFWERTSKNESFSYSRQSGCFGPKLPRQMLTSIAYNNGLVIAGASCGNIGVWKGKACIRVISLNTIGSIRSLYSLQSDGSNTMMGKVFAGSTDGKIFILDNQFELLASHATSSYGGIEKAITSLHWSPKSHRILVGIESCDVFEVRDDDGMIIGPILEGHFGDELNCLSANPVDENEVATVSTDRTLRIWDAQKHGVRKVLKLDSPASCLSYSADGEHIFIGLGSMKNKGDKKEGAFQVFNRKDLTLQHQSRDSKQTLTDCKYSMDGKYVAFASMDSNIYIYERCNFSLVARAKGHTAAVRNIDFGCIPGGTNANFLQSNSSNGEVMFWNIKGKLQTPSSQRHTVLETVNCTLCWQMKGTHQQNENHIRIEACDRSKEGSLIAVGNSIGELCLYEYPVVANNSICSKFPGHAPKISGVRFSCSDRWLFTIGREDCCLFQWKLLKVVQNNNREKISASDEYIDCFKRFDRSYYRRVAQIESNHFVAHFEENPENDRMKKAPRPWQRAIVSPSKMCVDCRKQPFNKIGLKWIHGYNGSTAINNLHYGKNEEILYSVGRTFVNISLGREQRQQFYQETTDEITCLAIHPGESICAIGQIGYRPIIHCIDYIQMATEQLLDGNHRRAVIALRFDYSGNHLVSLGGDDYHTITIHSWKNQYILCSSQTDSRNIHDIQFSPTGEWLIQCGDNFVKFWSIDGDSLNCRDGYITIAEEVSTLEIII